MAEHEDLIGEARLIGDPPRVLLVEVDTACSRALFDVVEALRKAKPEERERILAAAATLFGLMEPR